MRVATRENCGVCFSQSLYEVIDLPKLPLTGVYSPHAPKENLVGYDQVLLRCAECGQAQLSYFLDPKLIYGGTYSFRTSVSPTAQKGTEFFLSFLDSVAKDKKFKCALDLGCNDLHLLKKLRPRAASLMGIDPIWQGRESGNPEKDIKVYGETIESLDLKKICDTPPDLIVCRHTLEHIYEPRKVIELLKSVAAPDALFVFEVPGLDPLIRRFRFDQVFHQHLNYFSVSSFARLFRETGFEFISWKENYHDWGALAVAFRPSEKPTTKSEELKPTFSEAELKSRYQVFTRQMQASSEIISSFSAERLVGYGAAQMLPVLCYHLKNDLSQMKMILDDDPAKDGIFYENLSVPIALPEKCKNFSDCTVVITAIDNAMRIIEKIKSRPKHLVYPFHIF